LLLEPGGFEGLRSIPEILLPDHQALSQLEELKHPLVHGHAAPRSMCPDLNRDEKLVPEVEDLLRLQPEVLECIEPRSPHLSVPVMAVKNRILVGGYQIGSGVKFDGRIKPDEEEVEVSTVSRRVCPPYKTGKQEAPHLRSRQQ